MEESKVADHLHGGLVAYKKTQGGVILLSLFLLFFWISIFIDSSCESSWSLGGSKGLFDFSSALANFSIFIDKVRDIVNSLTYLYKSFNAAVGSAQSRLLPQGRRFAELAGQSVEMDVSDQIDEVVREIQVGE